MSWIKITKQAYFNSLDRNRDKLTVFASCTDSDYVLTSWGFKDSGIQFIKAVDQRTCDGMGSSLEWEYQYFNWV